MTDHHVNFMQLLLSKPFKKKRHFNSCVTPSQRLYLLSMVALADSFQIIRYDRGGWSSVINFIQQILQDSTEDSRVTMAEQMLAKIEPDIPIYHIRAMRKAFKKTTFYSLM